MKVLFAIWTLDEEGLKSMLMSEKRHVATKKVRLMNN